MLGHIYYPLMRARAKFYSCGILKQKKLPCAVISVGNIAWGGAGKTPCVIDIAERAAGRGKKVCVAARGYLGRRAGREIFRVTAQTTVEEAGDEAVLLFRRLADGIPVYVGPDKSAAAEAACRDEKPDVIIVDDGFSHLRLHRDLDLVVMDASSPFADRVFPCGMLREPPDCLARAGGIILTRTDAAGLEGLRNCAIGIARHNTAAPVAETRFRPDGWLGAGAAAVIPLGSMDGKKLAAFAGIVDTDGFRFTLKSCGCDIAWMQSFPDHHNYSTDELETLRRRADSDGAQLVTTEKDAVRLPDGFPAMALRIRLEWLRGFDRIDKMMQDILQ